MKEYGSAVRIEYKKITLKQPITFPSFKKRNCPPTGSKGCQEKNIP